MIYHDPGQYDVTLTASNACGSDTKTIENFITVEPLSLTEDYSAGGILLFPNPAREYLELRPVMPGGIVTVMDLSMKVVKSFTAQTVYGRMPIGDLSPGIYFLAYRYGDYPFFRKFVVIR